MIIGVVQESLPGEKRVAMAPNVLPSLTKAGLEVLIQSGAGTASGYLDKDYQEKGAQIAKTREEVFEKATILFQVNGFGTNLKKGSDDLSLLREGQIVIATQDPLTNPEKMTELAKTGAKAFALELVPRITRAQSMDILSSMANLAGYKAVLIGADNLVKIFPMMMTAAGTIAPAKVFVLGAGVAGLQAIATAKRLGAVVYSYDVRPAVKEQVESLGGKFVELNLETSTAEDSGGYAKEQSEDFIKKQREMMLEVLSDVDVAITTAAIPGRKAPILITKEMVAAMKPGSVIVDLAAERGGNCELTKAGKTTKSKGVVIVGPQNVPSMVAYHASQMYGKNISTFLLNMVKDGELNINLEDEIVKDSLICENGEVVNERILSLLNKE